MTRAVDERDWVATVAERLPVSPLTVLGTFLAAVIGARVAAENRSGGGGAIPFRLENAPTASR